MASWTDDAVLIASLASGKAYTDEKAQAQVENVVAQAEGAMNAPKTVSDALDTSLGDMALTTTYAGFTGLSARLKKIVVDAGVFGRNTSGATSGIYRLQMRVSADNGATWSGDINLGTSRNLGIAGSGALMDSEAAAGATVVDLQTGAWRSMIFGSGGSGTTTALINAIQFRLNVTSGTITPTGHLAIHGISGISP